jgi:hypothetical protein
MTASSAPAAGLGSDAVVVEYDASFDYGPGPPNGSTATMTAGLVPRCLKREFEPRAECGIPPAWLQSAARCRQCGRDFPLVSSDPNLKRLVTSGYPVWYTARVSYIYAKLPLPHSMPV